jgi:hypothetical protein
MNGIRQYRRHQQSDLSVLQFESIENGLFCCMVRGLCSVETKFVITDIQYLDTQGCLYFQVNFIGFF